MSIIVDQVTKLYGEQKALDRVSFRIEPGNILGLLGPNGAGKSTIMKIITCFIPPTSGEVSVYGFDIYEQSDEIRKKIGYLPEHNPLYPDMYVKEYLAFIAGLHHLKNKKKRVKEMIDITGLQIEQNKKIGALSKGYRQRVGLAQVLIHDPEVLILDEPTTGLDPNQIVEIRELIKKIGKEKTVMLSTHIMQEVEAICNRAIIINKGVIVADDDTVNLSKYKADKEVITVEFDRDVRKEQLKKISGTTSVKKLQDRIWTLESTSGKDLRPAIFKFAVDNNFTVLSMNKESRSIESVFQQLTK
ncbi:MAG: gliding motility-associated ABC transporter ATP-binding subunit GldA [Bacteroidales bacterium]|nr:gliding motility-associated ABC transporter ATP-binding subunit GldA [Bacteroidales bacterium]MCF8344077.1 gliding motility-associated ABC transporter ATP-binding subunit GldA [Bacteroidales bacterium]MCF8349737.1 gliding motility-associated ABC transporter ATP-binding subunit GldA [Bacteroidales bacterium]MCF8376662.1 gliding motility-associated ABC transporter ATP-binding subunit GldA [Bacteroidales bacterium]MCF8402044.1 gliding motility-associated ABC transporter ATP-binding subunit GldA